MRSALIVGASGQDGRLLTRLLVDRGYIVRGWTRTKPEPPIDCECAQVDLFDSRSLERELRKLRPNEVYYLAAFHHSTEASVEVTSTELTRRSYEVHVKGVGNVLGAIKVISPQIRFFYAASSHVFGEAVAESQNEQTPFAPKSVYGASKAAGIECCRLFREAGIFAATGILFNHESSLRKGSFLSQKVVQGALQARREPAFKLVLGDLDARVDWGYAPDYVDAMFRILQLPKADDFVVASGELHTVREFAQAAFATVGLDWSQYIKIDMRLLKRDSQPLCGDTAKLRAATGWSQSVSFSEMVARLVREAEKNMESSKPFIFIPGSEESENPERPSREMRALALVG
jgi:GDPmannose 4,6-dehydratase